MASGSGKSIEEVLKAANASDEIKSNAELAVQKDGKTPLVYLSAMKLPPAPFSRIRSSRTTRTKGSLTPLFRPGGTSAQGRAGLPRPRASPSRTY